MSPIVLTFEEYQAFAMQTAAIYPRTAAPVGNEPLDTIPVYPAMAALGEAGELCEKIVDGGRAQLPYLKELGDVLWYITASAVELKLAREPGRELWAVATRDGVINDMRGWSMSTVSGMTAELEAIKLVAALGRYSERVKKCWRENTRLDRLACSKDLATALFQIHNVAMCFYSDIATVAQTNVDKLASRRARGTLLGSGDNR